MSIKRGKSGQSTVISTVLIILLVIVLVIIISLVIFNYVKKSSSNVSAVQIPLSITFAKYIGPSAVNIVVERGAGDADLKKIKFIFNDVSGNSKPYVVDASTLAPLGSTSYDVDLALLGVENLTSIDLAYILLVDGNEKEIRTVNSFVFRQESLGPISPCHVLTDCAIGTECEEPSCVPCDKNNIVDNICCRGEVSAKCGNLGCLGCGDPGGPGNPTCSCDGKTCGDDGCGVSCGTCSGAQTCQNGNCVTTLVTSYVKDWEKEYTSRPMIPGEYTVNHANAIAIGGSGKVYVTGFSDFGSASRIVIYDNQGNIISGSIITGEYGADYADLSLDSSENIYVTSYSYGSKTFKYSSTTGQKLSEFAYGGRSVAVDSSGKVYVTGSITLNSNTVYRTVKYNSDGSSIWDKSTNPQFTGTPSAVTFDSSGNAYVAGRYNDQYLILKYDSSGNIGTPITAAISGNIAAPTGIAVDASGNIYVTGSYFVNVPRGNPSIYTIKYDSSGTKLWEKIYSGDYGASASSIAIDQFGNVYVAGSKLTSAAGAFNFYVKKYDFQGNEIWNDSPTTSASTAQSIAVDNSGNVYVTGWKTISIMNDVFYTVKYKPSA